MSIVDQITLSERYCKAMQSSHLEMSPHRRGDIDILMAAACCKDEDGKHNSMGSLLFRLMCEFDNAIAPHKLARKNLQVMTGVLQNITSRAKGLPIGSEAHKQAEELATIISKDTEASAKNAYAHVLLKLPSLYSTKESFGNWAMMHAQKYSFMAPGEMPVDSGKFKTWRKATEERQKIVYILAGRVLDLIMEPTCSRCGGRGFSGGYNGTPQTICSKLAGCGGSGRRRTDNIGNSHVEHTFASYLIGKAEKSLIEAEYQMSEKLRVDKS